MEEEIISPVETPPIIVDMETTTIPNTNLSIMGADGNILDGYVFIKDDNVYTPVETVSVAIEDIQAVVTEYDIERQHTSGEPLPPETPVE